MIKAVVFFYFLEYCYGRYDQNQTWEEIRLTKYPTSNLMAGDGLFQRVTGYDPRHGLGSLVDPWGFNQKHFHVGSVFCGRENRVCRAGRGARPCEWAPAARTTPSFVQKHGEKAENGPHVERLKLECQLLLPVSGKCVKYGEPKHSRRFLVQKPKLA